MNTNQFDIAIHHDRPLGVDLRELHSALESKKDFSTWAKSKLAQFEEGRDFEILLPQSGEQVHGGHNRIDYAVSLDCAKHIAMMEQTERGRQVRAYFIDCERRLKDQASSAHALPGDYIEALEALVVSEKEKKQLSLANAEMRPKAEFYDTVTASDDSTQLAIACQVLGLPFGRNTLFQRLRQRGVLVTGGDRHNLPKQRYVEQGLFTVKESSYLDDERQPHVRFTPLVTQKGLDWLRREFGRVAA